MIYDNLTKGNTNEKDQTMMPYIWAGSGLLTGFTVGLILATYLQRNKNVSPGEFHAPFTVIEGGKKKKTG